MVLPNALAVLTHPGNMASVTASAPLTDPMDAQESSAVLEAAEALSEASRKMISQWRTDGVSWADAD